MADQNGSRWRKPEVIIAGAALLVTIVGVLLAFVIGFTSEEGFRAWVTWWLEWLRGHLLIGAAGVLAIVGVALLVVVRKWWRRRAAKRAAEEMLAAKRRKVMFKAAEEVFPAKQLGDRIAELCNVGKELEVMALEKPRSSDAESAIEGVPDLGLRILQLSLSHYERYHSGPAMVRVALLFPELSSLPRELPLEEAFASLLRAGLVKRREAGRDRGSIKVWLSPLALGLNEDGALSVAVRKELELRGSVTKD